jgi:hypothetical protein
VGIGLYLIVIAAWADMESSFYGFSRLAEAGLRGFNCPVLMTRDETRTISLKVSNTTDGTIIPSVKTEISTSLVLQEFNENIELAPGESKRLEWSVGPENIDLKHFIFAKALVFSAYPLPSQEANCGIFIVDLPGSGRVILPILVALGLLGMGWGLYGMSKVGASNEWVENHVRPMAFLAVIVVLGIVVSFMGGWVQSILLLAVALLMIIILLGSLLMYERRKR